MIDGPPPMRMSRPPAAWRAAARAPAGPAPGKWNVVPPCISSQGRRWRVRTKTGVWNTGLSPRQPFHSSPTQGPRCGPDLFRPMISAPMPAPRCWQRRRPRPCRHRAGRARRRRSGCRKTTAAAGHPHARREHRGLPLTSAESVQRHAEVMDAHPRHGDLRTAMPSNTTRGKVPSIRTPHRSGPSGEPELTGTQATAQSRRSQPGPDVPRSRSA